MPDLGKSHSSDSQKDQSRSPRERSPEGGQRTPRNDFERPPERDQTPRDQSPSSNTEQARPPEGQSSSHNFERGRRRDQPHEDSDSERSQSTEAPSIFSHKSRASSIDGGTASPQVERLRRALLRSERERNEWLNTGPSQTTPHILDTGRGILSSTERENLWARVLTGNSNQARPVEQSPESSNTNEMDQHPTPEQLRQIRTDRFSPNNDGNSNQARPVEQNPESPSTNEMDQHPTPEQLRQMRLDRFSPNNDGNKQPESKPDEDEQGH